MYSRKLTVEFLDHFTFFILYYSIFSFLVVLDTNRPALFLHGAFLLIPFTINFILRRFTKNLGVLLLTHAPMPIVVGFVLASFGNPFWWVIMAITLAIHSIVAAFHDPPTNKARLRARFVETNVLWEGKIIFLLTCFILIGGASVISNLEGFAAVIFPSLLTIAVVGRILLVRMVKIDVSLDTMHNVYNQPINKIMNFDYKFTLGLGAVFIAFAVVLYLITFAPLFGLLTDNIPDVRFDIDTEDHGLFRYFSGAPTAPTGDRILFQERGIWSVIASILFFIVGIVMTIGIVYSIYRILKLIAGRKAAKFIHIPQPEEPQDEKEFILPRSNNHRRRRALEASLHPIRRLFRDTARKHIKLGVPIKESDTPTDMTRRIITEDISTLANEYAEVRYKV